jgi:thiol-disulfide isomerase/thioredoxin
MDVRDRYVSKMNKCKVGSIILTADNKFGQIGVDIRLINPYNKNVNFMKYSIFLISILITFNLPAQECSVDSLSSEVIKTVNPSQYTLNEIHKMQLFDSTFAKSTKQYSEKNGNEVGFTFDFTSYYKYLRKIIVSNEDLFLRKYAAMQLPKIYYEGCNLMQSDTALQKMCLRILRPEDIIWRINISNSIIFFANLYVNPAIKEYTSKLGIPFSKLNSEQKKAFYEFALKKSLEYRLNIYNKNPDRIVRANALRNILDVLYLYQDYKKADYYYNILKKDYSDINMLLIKNALIEYNPEGRLKDGKTVPEFNLRLIGSEKTISPAKLTGKYYLIQFWATWCGPCVAELPEIKNIYNKYKNSHFTIVSISLDNSLETLKSFWNKKMKMPWYNIILRNGFNDEVVKYFGITSVPATILVNPEGKILANSNDFRKNGLSKTVDSLLNHN